TTARSRRTVSCSLRTITVRHGLNKLDTSTALAFVNSSSKPVMSPEIARAVCGHEPSQESPGQPKGRKTPPRLMTGRFRAANCEDGFVHRLPAVDNRRGTSCRQDRPRLRPAPPCISDRVAGALDR